MKLLIFMAIALLVCSARAHESQNRFNTGVQTFESPRNGSEGGEEAKAEAEAHAEAKPLPQTYTVVDWKRYYPFGDKFPDLNHTDVADRPRSNDSQLVLPVYIKVPIRVPLKGYRKTRTVRGGKGVGYPYRYVFTPRYTMIRHLPIRRKFVTYYPKPVYRRRYIKPLYHKTGLHDLYKKNVYYKLRGHGYEVREGENVKNFYDTANDLA